MFALLVLGPLAMLGMYHLWLVGAGTTTNEHMKINPSETGLEHTNPYSHGFLRNVARTLCGPLPMRCRPRPARPPAWARAG